MVSTLERITVSAWCDHATCATWLFSATGASDVAHLDTQLRIHADTGHAPSIAAVCRVCGEQTPTRHVLAQTRTDIAAHECGLIPDGRNAL